MRVVSKAALRRYWLENERSREALEVWHKNVANAEWASFAELKASYPTADVVRGATGRVVFNIAGNSYRLVAVIVFLRHGVLIRWIGTHAEYDRIDAKQV